MSVTAAKPFQEQVLTEIAQLQARKEGTIRLLLALDMGMGKAQPIATPVLTPTGWCPIGQIKVGDRVIGVDGLPTMVLGVHPQGIKKAFRVVFSDGSSTECCDAHLWTVNTPLRKSRGLPPKTLSLQEIRAHLTHKNGNRRHFIPLVSAVEFDKTTPLPIHPYLLGYILANGCTRSTSIVISMPDAETVNRIQKLLPADLHLVTPPTGKIDYRASRKKTSKLRHNPLTTILRQLGIAGKMAHEKHIPPQFLLSSIPSRLELLRGLMDGDGWCSSRGHHLEYDTTSPALANDVVSLVQSLGGTAKLRRKLHPKYTYKGEIRTGRTCYMLTISMPQNMNPFQLSRKAVLHKERTKYQPSRSVASVVPIGKRECVCIQVAAQDGLYVTSDYIVTHNTYCSLAIARKEGFKKIVVICPASLKLHWKKECKVHFGLTKSVAILSSQTVSDRKRLRECRILVINYDILESWLPFLKSFKPDLIILDECQLLGNMRSLRTRVCRRLCKHVKHIIAASGTPLTNRPWELFPVLNMLMPNKFKSPMSFGMKYCHGDKAFGRWRFTGAKNLPGLHKVLRKHLMIRYTKAEVLKDLPPLTWEVLPVPIENRREYVKAETDLIGWLSGIDLGRARRAASNERRVRMGYLKRLTAQSKMPYVLPWIQEFLDGKGKIMLGVIHKATTKALLEAFGKYAVVIDGSKTMNQRREAEEAFQTDKKVRILIGQIRACGLGLNLTAADVVAFLELGWTPGEHQQFAARPHRMTSTKPVKVYYLVAHNTIEEQLCKIIQKKQKILDQVLDGVSVRVNSLTIFDELHAAMLRKQHKHKRNPHESR